jgi:hypothetical protein
MQEEKETDEGKSEGNWLIRKTPPMEASMGF